MRKIQLFDVAFGAEKLFFCVCAKQLGAGLDEQLQRFVREHPDTRLIIVDTLQKIRETCGDNYSYSNDYEVIGHLKRFADYHKEQRKSIWNHKK